MERTRGMRADLPPGVKPRKTEGERPFTKVAVSDKPIPLPVRPVEIASRILRQEGYIDSCTVIVPDMVSWEDLKEMVHGAVEVGLRDTGRPVGVVVIYEH